MHRRQGGTMLPDVREQRRHVCTTLRHRPRRSESSYGWYVSLRLAGCVRYRLHKALGNYSQAAQTALLIAKQEQDMGPAKGNQKYHAGGNVRSWRQSQRTAGPLLCSSPSYARPGNVLLLKKFEVTTRSRMTCCSRRTGTCKVRAA